MSELASTLGTCGSTGELVQQLALLNWLKKNDASSRQTLEQVTQLRVVADVWNRLTHESELETARAQTILAISEYVKNNPRASKADMTKFVAEQIQKFATVVEAI